MQKINPYSHIDPSQGSVFYYSSRYLSKIKREIIFAIADFYQIIEKITLNNTDLIVAQAKLNWWRDQVIKMQDDLPDHPLAQILQKKMQRFKLNPLRLISLIDGLEQNLSAPIFAKFEDVVIYLMQTAGVRELLIVDVLQQEHQIEAIYQCMLVIELVNHLQNLRRYVSKGLILFSQEELQRFQVSDDDLRKLQTTEKIKNLLQFQAEKIDRSFQASKSLNVRFFSARCKVATAILRAIESEDFQVLEKFVTITRGRCWWVCR